MATRYYNVTGSTGVDVELLAPNSGVGGVRSISIANVHAANTGTVNLFIQDNSSSTAPSTYYIMKTVSIPSGVTLVVDDVSILSFSKIKYGLYMTVGSSDTLDVMINT